MKNTVFLPYMEVIRPLQTVDETFGCIWPRCITDEGVHHTLKRVVSISARKGLVVCNWFATERLETLQACVTVVRRNNAIAVFYRKDSVAIAATLSEQI